jgi:hypothetical protein
LQPVRDKHVGFAGAVGGGFKTGLVMLFPSIVTLVIGKSGYYCLLQESIVKLHFAILDYGQFGKFIFNELQALLI